MQNEPRPDRAFTVRRAVGEADFEAALAVRRAVFVDEQGGPAEEEPDAYNSEARHFMMEADGRVVGTARLVSLSERTGKIGRVCLLREARGRGWGAALMRCVVAGGRAEGFRELVLHAQVYAVPFYERCGFRAEGEEFVEDGLLHRRMRMRIADE